MTKSYKRSATYDSLVHPKAKLYPGKHCNWCGRSLPKFKRSFCSNHCVHSWSVRTSSSYARSCVLKRDGWVCALCGLDIKKFEKELKAKFPRKTKKRTEFLKSLGFPGKKTSIAEIDHLIPVVKGGGECDLSNLRVLCSKCHKQCSNELMEELRKAKEAKEPDENV